MFTCTLVSARRVSADLYMRLVQVLGCTSVCRLMDISPHTFILRVSVMIQI